MQDNPSLLSRMKDRAPQGEFLQPQPLDSQPEAMLLSRMSQKARTPSLLARMTSPDSMQGLLPNPARGATKTYSSTVIPSLKDIERGRS
jgi:hypothetical protein